MAAKNRTVIGLVGLEKLHYGLTAKRGIASSTARNIAP
jgi:hypothetical protein